MQSVYPWRNGMMALVWLWGAAGALSQTRYEGDGVLSARCEAQRWMINRARFAPEQETDRLGLTNSAAGGHPDYDVCEDTNGVNNFGTTTNAWLPWTRSLAPLAPNARLSTASTKHSLDMAQTGVFSHYSPSTNFYPLNSDPGERALLEGYTNAVVGYYENIAYGYRGSTGSFPPYGRDVTNVHVALFVDYTATNRGHRQAILNSNAREIGLGTFRTNKIDGVWRYTYDYDTQDFGRNSSNHFFTDTIFYDANTNGVYDEGEGRAGVEVWLHDFTNYFAHYDCSHPSGNMAIPLMGLPAGRALAVVLRNTNAAPQALSIPLNYTTLGRISLSNNEEFLAGVFVKSMGNSNVGFRNLSPAVSLAGWQGGTLMALAYGNVPMRLEYGDSWSGVWTPLVVVTAQNQYVEFPLPDGYVAPMRFYRASMCP